MGRRTRFADNVEPSHPTAAEVVSRPGPGESRRSCPPGSASELARPHRARHRASLSDCRSRRKGLWAFLKGLYAMPFGQSEPTDKVSTPQKRWWVASWNGATTFAFTDSWMLAREFVAVELGVSNDYAGLITIPVLLAQFPESYRAPYRNPQGPGLRKTAPPARRSRKRYG